MKGDFSAPGHMTALPVVFEKAILDEDGSVPHRANPTSASSPESLGKQYHVPDSWHHPALARHGNQILQNSSNFQACSEVDVLTVSGPDGHLGNMDAYLYLIVFV